jgi:S1-C subfamily serine protease
MSEEQMSENQMSENQGEPIQPLNPEPVEPDHSLLPPGPMEAGAGGAGDLAWAPTAPAAAVRDNSLWHRIAAYVVLVAVVAAAAGAGIGWSIARWAIDHRSSATTTQPLVPNDDSNQSGGNLTQSAITAKVDPAIVDINTVIGSSSAAGTGMIITSSGEVLTNHHVVAGSTSIKVTIAGQSQPYTAHVVGVDPSADVALIQIEGVSGLPTVKFAKSSSLAVGDTVIALGNALGQGGTPRANRGTVTALDQSITAGEGGSQSEQLSGMIESDAVIYPGDSGGALVNQSGQVVGMITAGQPQGFRSSASNIGYAVPSDAALSVINRLRAGEQASDLIYNKVGYLGVNVQTLDSTIAAQLGLTLTSGVLVSGVVAGSPADDAGLSRYSVITAFGGTSIDTSEALGTAIKSHQPGDQVSMTWVAQDGSHTTSVTLGGVNP